MESIGKKLQEARMARGLDLDQISLETNIARRYLEDLENEKFDDFPGESYLIGFLRNYCEYLDLDGNELVNLYRNQKIQEINVPASALIPPRPLFERLFGQNAGRVKVALLVLLLLAAGAAGVVLLLPHLQGAFPAAETPQTPVREPAVHTLSGTEFKGRGFTGDQITVPVDGKNYTLLVEETAGTVRLNAGGTVRVVELGQELVFDVSGDDVPDVRVFVSDLYPENPSMGAELLVETALSAADTAEPEGGVTVSVPSGTAAAGNAGQTVLFESGSAFPVTLNATFRGYCLFRYEIDREERDERLYQKSEILTIQARNGLRIWASNGNAVKIQVIAAGQTVDLELSRPGEVIVRDLRWLRDDATGRYRFVLMDVD